MITVIKKLFRDENGQAFPLALVVLAMGSLFVTGFLTSANTSLLTAKVYSEPIPDNYAADAGIEDAIWNLVYGNFTIFLRNPGDSWSYSPTESINGYTPEVTVTRVNSPLGSVPVILVSEDCETRGGDGGFGWLVPWTGTQARLSERQDAYSGVYSAELFHRDSYLTRSANLTGQSGLYLKIATKAKDFGATTVMQLLVSPDGSQWSTARVWGILASDGIWHQNTIDLLPYTMSSEFWIAFDWLNYDKGTFYFDDLIISGGIVTYEIVSTVAEARTTAVVEFDDDGTMNILSWQID